MKNTIKAISILLFTLISFSGIAQKKKDILMHIGKVPVSKAEFIANYKKNNTNILDEKDKKTPEEYLDLYTNFKLKVIEAQALGYDTLKTFKDELSGYRQELAKQYLTDVLFSEEMVETAYHRTKYERKASHLLIMLNAESSPADTIIALEKMQRIKKMIDDGADFNETAAEYSDDPTAKENKGLLGYFSAFQMIYPFEDMAYKTPVGKVSDIKRTQYGYHIIKIHDEREARGEIKVAHIMKMFPPNATDEIISILKSKSDSIYNLLINGGDFVELARTYSDDKNSSENGGIMNWFSPTNMVPEFAEASFALKNDGDISPVIKTPYGWHIIKRIEHRPIQSFEVLKPVLENKIKQNPGISKYCDESFDKKLREEYNFKLEKTNFRRIIDLASDSLKSKNLINSLSFYKDQILFRFANKEFTILDFSSFLSANNYTPYTNNPEPALQILLDRFINEKLLEYENSVLEKKHPEFANIYREYHDGILLFNISKDKIWDAASNDTIRLQKYFESTDKKHYWAERYKGWIVKTNDRIIRSRLERMLDEREMSKKEINDFFNKNHETNVQIIDVAVEKGENPIVDFFIWNGPRTSEVDESTTFVHGKIVKNELKKLNDAWGLYASDFQEVIEKEWIDSLKKKYPVRINKKVFKSLPQ